MKFRKGDQVRFLNDIGGGTVVRVDEKGFVYVLTPDGFEVPVPEKELVSSGGFDPLDNRSYEAPVPETGIKTATVIQKPVKTVQENIPVHPRNIPRSAPVNLILGFMPLNEGPVFNNEIGCFLVNDSPYNIYYMCGKKEGGKMYYLASGLIEADTKVLIKSFDQTSLSKISHIHVQLLLVAGGIYTHRLPIDIMVNLNLVNFSKESYFRENEYFEEKAVLFDLTGKSGSAADVFDIPGDVKEQKMQADKVERPKPKEEVSDIVEVDLHYDSEGAAGSQLTPSAILALQLSRFHSAIEDAIGKNARRLVVIHGLGQGTLKMQIRKELQEKYPGYTYQDASFKEYGFGATMVYLNTEKKQ